MKVVLRKDVEKLGEAGSVQTVADGFARNYLIPKGLAVLATSGELKVVAENTRVRDMKIARQERQLQDLADKISGQRLEFTARSGDQGRLYGSITAGDIAERLSTVVGQEIDRRKVVLADPIRSVGEHTVTVHLVGRLRPQVTVVVKGEQDPAEEPEAEASTESAEASDTDNDAAS
jgi:large subunit ribosomal protein L9